jgi:hypothetical protein
MWKSLFDFILIWSVARHVERLVAMLPNLYWLFGDELY